MSLFEEMDIMPMVQIALLLNNEQLVKLLAVNKIIRCELSAIPSIMVRLNQIADNVKIYKMFSLPVLRILKDRKRSLYSWSCLLELKKYTKIRITYYRPELRWETIIDNKPLDYVLFNNNNKLEYLIGRNRYQLRDRMDDILNIGKRKYEPLSDRQIKQLLDTGTLDDLILLTKARIELLDRLNF